MARQPTKRMETRAAQPIDQALRDGTLIELVPLKGNPFIVYLDARGSGWLTGETWYRCFSLTQTLRGGNHAILGTGVQPVITRTQRLVGVVRGPGNHHCSSTAALRSPPSS